MPALWRSTITRAWPTPKVLTGQGKDAACAFRHRSIQWFEEVLGAPVRQVLTDNGHAYRSHDWRHACTQLDSEHIPTRPYTLGTNGKAERLIKTMLGGLGLPLQLPHKRTPHSRPCGLGAVVQQAQTSCLTRGQAPGESCRAGVWSARARRGLPHPGSRTRRHPNRSPTSPRAGSPGAARRWGVRGRGTPCSSPASQRRARPRTDTGRG